MGNTWLFNNPQPSIALDRPAIIQARPSHDRNGRVRLAHPGTDREINGFLAVFALLSIGSLYALKLDWFKIIVRLPDTADVLLRLTHLSFDRLELAGIAFLESLSVTILATLYSLLSGLFFGAIMARNLSRSKLLSAFLSAIFSFIRAVPTPIWVLLALVCLGFGPAPGIVGLSLHAIAFFARAFKQAFEEVPADTLEAIQATGANRLQIFFGAVLPASLTQIMAWGALRLEINFAESAILGMVGAGGIGYTIMAAMSSYELGRAGTAILMIFIFLFILELLFTAMKRRIKA